MKGKTYLAKNRKKKKIPEREEDVTGIMRQRNKEQGLLSAQLWDTQSQVLAGSLVLPQGQ